MFLCSLQGRPWKGEGNKQKGTTESRENTGEKEGKGEEKVGGEAPEVVQSIQRIWAATRPIFRKNPLHFRTR